MFFCAASRDRSPGSSETVSGSSSIFSSSFDNGTDAESERHPRRCPVGWPSGPGRCGRIARPGRLVVIELEEPLGRRVAECRERSAGAAGPRAASRAPRAASARRRSAARAVPSVRAPTSGSASVSTKFRRRSKPPIAPTRKRASGFRRAITFGRPNRATPPTTTSEISRSVAVSRRSYGSPSVPATTSRSAKCPARE